MIDPIAMPHRAWLVLPLLVATHAATNLLLFPHGIPTEWLEQLILGAVFVQPVLFAIWIVLGAGASVKRVPLTLVSFVMVVLASGITSWNLLSRWEPQDPLTLRDLMRQLGLFAFVAVAMMAVRGTTGWRIFCPSDSLHADSSPNQYSVRFLIGWMTVFALLLVIAPNLVKGGAPHRSEYVLMVISLGLIALMLMPAMYIPLFVVSLQPKFRQLLLLLISWFALGWLAIETFAVVSVAYNMMPNGRGEIASLTAMVQTGAVSAGTASALALRWAGYRLLPVRQRSAETQT